jgi:hypothetical protein
LRGLSKSGSNLQEILYSLERLDLLLKQAVAAAQNAYGPGAASDAYRGIYINQDEAERLLARKPGVHVTGPDYLEVEVEAAIAPKDPAEAGIVENQAREALQTLLHPLRGGSRGRGWEPGRAVFLAEVAAVLERLDRVDYVAELALLLGGVVQGNRSKFPQAKPLSPGISA